MRKFLLLSFLATVNMAIAFVPSISLKRVHTAPALINFAFNSASRGTKTTNAFSGRSRNCNKKYLLYDSTKMSEFSSAASNYPAFLLFYEETVPFGSPMSLDQFLQYEPVDALIQQEQLLADDVSDIWISLWGCNCKCLYEEEAYKTFIEVYNSKKAASWLNFVWVYSRRPL